MGCKCDSGDKKDQENMFIDHLNDLCNICEYINKYFSKF